MCNTKVLSRKSSEIVQEPIAELPENEIEVENVEIKNELSPNQWVTAPHREIHEDFMRSAFELILSGAIFEGISRQSPVLRFQLPEDLKETINFELGAKPCEKQQDLLEIIEQVIHFSVKTGNPRFVNQLFSGLDPIGVIGDMVTTALNPSVYTYEVSPVFTLMEQEVTQKMREIIGFPEGRGDGLFCPGGSIANGYAISLARYRAHPEIKEYGLSSLKKELVLFVSEDCHYSMQKLASFQGLGSKNVIGVKVDSRGKMRVDELRREIMESRERGQEPFFVAATAGTTVLGAFDPIEEIAQVCKEEGLWCHVDAAWGGGALMSQKYRKRMTGIEFSDSVTWNPHKLLCCPQQCSVLLTRHEGIANGAHATNATYLFQKDKFYDSKNYDTGDKVIQCGRKADVFKFFLMWKAKGIQGFEAHINHVFAISEYCVEQISKRYPDFHLILPDPECTNVSFWYIPPSLQNLEKDSEEFLQKIHKIAPKIKERMMKAGSMMVTYQPLKEIPNFFRIVFQSSELNQSDVDFFLNEIERLGKDL